VKKNLLLDGIYYLMVDYINVIHNQATHTTEWCSFTTLIMFFEAFQPSTPLAYSL